MTLDRVLVVLALSSITACGSASESSPPSRTPVPPPTTALPPPPPPIPAARVPYDAVLDALPSATALRITEGWMGLTPIGPLAHHYELSATDAGFVARLVCHAGTRELAQPDQTIPRDSLAPILAQLRTVEVTTGTYAPRIEHTDDYPNLSIEIDSPAGTLAFTSGSQGEDAEPWQIATGSDTAIVASAIPGQALHALGALVGIQRCRDWVGTLR